MPKRLSTEQIRQRFAQYGFTVVDPNFQYRNNKQQIRVRDDINNTERNITMNNFSALIRRGRLAEVDPFLHALNQTETLTLPGMTSEERKIQRFASNQIPQFTNESLDVQRQSVRNAEKMIRQALRGHDVSIVRTHDPTTDRTNLYAFIDTVYNVAEHADEMKNKRISVEISANGIDSYLFINENTIGMLNDLIQHVYFGEPLRELTDSSTAALFSLISWDSMTIRFHDLIVEDVNALNGPKIKRRQRNAGALWKYINTSDIDLSKYGIFKSFDPINYKYSCFVYALQQSGKFTDEEIDLINDSINTRAYPCDTIKKLCELFDFSITLSKYSEEKKCINKTKRYGNNKEKHIHLLLRDGHYMINEPLPITPYYLKHMRAINESVRVNQLRKYSVRNLSDKSVAYHKNPSVDINQAIDILIEQKLFRKFTPKQTFTVLNKNKHHDFTNLTFSDKCIKECMNECTERMNTMNECTILNLPEENMPPLVYTSNIQAFTGLSHAKIIKYKSAITKVITPTSTIRNLKLLFMFEPTVEEIQQLHDLLAEKFEINFYEYDSLAQIGEEIMKRCGCFNDCVKLAGKPSVFIKQCAPKICVQPAFNKPLRVSGSLVQIDKNGSYSATYRDFAGIPTGKPKVIETFTPHKWTHYYILIDIHSFKCKHSEDRFPLITQNGQFFCDKTTFEFILKHYDIDYTFISGYYFDESNNETIKTLADKLYNIRKELKSRNERIESCIKLILASLWGKAQSKRSILKNVFVSNDKFEDFAVYNHSFMYKSMPISDDSMIVSLLNPVNLHYTMPQFSTNVLSHARCALNEIFYRAADLNIPIYYSNTDSLVLPSEKVAMLGTIIGSELGQFKIERENISKFICISAKKYIQITPGEVKVVGLHKLKNKPEDVEQYFERLYELI